MSQGWTTIFMGPPIEAEILRARLETEGIPAFIHEDILRTIDPTVVGGAQIFDRAVQVPDSAVATARGIVENLDDESEMRPGERELPPDFFEEESEPKPDLSLRAMQLSRRVRFGAFAPYFMPFVLWQFYEYLAVVQKLGHEPPQHRWTIFAAFLSVVYFVVLCLIVFTDLHRPN